jgi:hypothetical protein
VKLGLDIERIVIEDPSLVAGRVERLGPLVEAELEQRLKREPLSGEPRGRERARVRPLDTAPATDQVLARELAERVIESLRGGGR